MPKTNKNIKKSLNRTTTNNKPMRKDPEFIKEVNAFIKATKKIYKL